MKRKNISSQIKSCKTMQQRCKPGSDRWNRYRVRMNKLKVKLD